MSKKRKHLPTPPPSPTTPRLVGMIEQSYSGPIPSAVELARYNQVLPNAAERILKMAEEQSAHRRSLEGSVVKSNIRRSYIGTIVATVVLPLCVIGGLILVFTGHDTAGATIVVTALGSFAGVYVWGVATQRKERETRSKILSGKQDK